MFWCLWCSVRTGLDDCTTKKKHCQFQVSLVASLWLERHLPANLLLIWVDSAVPEWLLCAHLCHSSELHLVALQTGNDLIKECQLQDEEGCQFDGLHFSSLTPCSSSLTKCTRHGWACEPNPHCQPINRADLVSCKMLIHSKLTSDVLLLGDYMSLCRGCLDDCHIYHLHQNGKVSRSGMNRWSGREAWYCWPLRYCGYLPLCRLWSQQMKQASSFHRLLLSAFEHSALQSPQ